MCGMHMPEWRLIKHGRTSRSFNNMEMRLKGRKVEVASQCVEMEFKLTGKEGDKTIKVVSLFTYLGLLLYQS